ncbi:ATP-binding cassette domain-containing protein [Pseudonocardia kunmingensis]|uniref:Ribose transport system ATP-binding protein n=1 Tax=Pseudonocardia kunmingensis TaxID=630975 RepID=A0A543DRD1_9PSEU|nr:ATP-binding cassette domain-containing protein [Pseudonocardia kunmingensis]TQM11895.1 ribose transport system ATP-binding protein [Pseudonocardia kunmingensis]
MTELLDPVPAGTGDAPISAAVRGAVVRFGTTTVLHGVDLELRAGEVHALVGQNGAGKSTLVKALMGVNPLAEGHIEVGGRRVDVAGPEDARGLGLEIVYQDQPLAPRLTVAENMFLGRERVRSGVLLDRAGMHRRAREVLERVGADCAPDDVVGDLTPTQRVQVSIAAALAAQPRVLVLDEPTAALGAAESASVFDLIRAARADGVAVLYISHRLHEITALADRVTVLRDGTRTSVAPAAGLSTQDIIAAMVGRDLEALFPDVPHTPGDALLEVRHLRSGELVRDMDLSVRAGEIVGLAGLVGSGASETLLALFGDRRATGDVRLAGAASAPSSPLAAVRRGIALVPEERRTEALFPGLSVRSNLTASSLSAHARGGVLSRRRERRTAEDLVERLGIVPRSAAPDVATLSGGNQQKVVVGRWLARGGRLYLVDEPTAGVDVAAKAEIYRHLGELAAGGAAVLVVSSDFEELIGLCDRILVVRDGVVAEELGRGEVDEEGLTARAAGAEESEVPAAVASAPAPAPHRPAWLRQAGVGVAMLAVVAALVAGSPGFLLSSGFWDVLRQAGTPMLLAAALAVALGAGAFDLSVGAVALLTATASATLVVAGVPTPLVLAAGVVAGAVIGAVNGGVAVLLRVPSFVATLGMLFLLVGITLGVNGGLAVTAQTPSFLLLGQGFVGPVPAIAITAVVVIAVVALVWRLTPTGLRLRAVGDDERTTRLRGVRTGWATVHALVLSGALSGLAGVLLASYASGATARDASLELLVSALAAAFLGSALTRTFLFDPATAAVGSLFVTATGAGLIANGLSDEWLGGVQGVVLLLAVLVAVARRRALGQVVIF